jgi:hypothetical protein
MSRLCGCRSSPLFTHPSCMDMSDKQVRFQSAISYCFVSPTGQHFECGRCPMEGPLTCPSLLELSRWTCPFDYCGSPANIRDCALAIRAGPRAGSLGSLDRPGACRIAIGVCALSDSFERNKRSDWALGNVGKSVVRIQRSTWPSSFISIRPRVWSPPMQSPGMLVTARCRI